MLTPLTAPDDDIDFDQIAYCSVATAPMSGEALTRLLRDAKALNQLDRITGVLLVHGNVFLQIFEGPSEAVQSLWKRLLRDTRHRCVVKLLDQSEVESRTFEGWSMQQVSIEEMRQFIHAAHGQADTNATRPWKAAMQAFMELLEHPEPEQLVQGWHT